VNPKNLQIAIPSSPKAMDQHIEPTVAHSKPEAPARPNVHSGSMSTTNADKGNIKLNKLTCNSTRHTSSKQNIFSQKGKADQKE
jgi:hypothetical protein